MSIEEFYSIELNEWTMSLEFYLGDLDILKERLQEVAHKNTGKSVLASVEHFQDQFIVQKENLQILRHDIQKQKEYLTAELKKFSHLNNLDITDAQHFLRERVQMTEKIFLELKHSFYRFLAKVF